MTFRGRAITTVRIHRAQSSLLGMTASAQKLLCGAENQLSRSDTGVIACRRGGEAGSVEMNRNLTASLTDVRPAALYYPLGCGVSAV